AGLRGTSRSIAGWGASALAFPGGGAAGAAASAFAGAGAAAGCAGWLAAGAAAAVPAPSVASSVSTAVPSETLSPTLILSSFTTPATGDGTSIVALSDSSETSGSSLLTVSPGFTSTSITGTFLKSPMSGTLTSMTWLIVEGVTRDS